MNFFVVLLFRLICRPEVVLPRGNRQGNYATGFRAVWNAGSYCCWSNLRDLSTSARQFSLHTPALRYKRGVSVVVTVIMYNIVQATRRRKSNRYSPLRGNALASAYYLARAPPAAGLHATETPQLSSQFFLPALPLPEVLSSFSTPFRSVLFQAWFFFSMKHFVTNWLYYCKVVRREMANRYLETAKIGLIEKLIKN